MAMAGAAAAAGMRASAACDRPVLQAAFLARPTSSTKAGTNCLKFPVCKIPLRTFHHASHLSAFRTRHCTQAAGHLRQRLSARANGDSSSAGSRIKDKDSKPVNQSFREKALDLVEKQAGYFWLLGPVVATSAIVVPTVLLSLTDLLQRSFWVGLGAIFGLDLLFVLAADAFFVLTDKAGHHQSVPGGTPPWIGPWEYTGYPKGLPYFWEYLSYAGVGISGLALVISIFSGKFGVAVAAFAPYMALIFIQAAYERLLCNDRLPTYPLVATVYTIYRFRQLARAMELFTAFGGGALMVWTVKSLLAVWTLYLATFLSQLPWLYCTWNSNRVT